MTAEQSTPVFTDIWPDDRAEWVARIVNISERLGMMGLAGALGANYVGQSILTDARVCPGTTRRVFVVPELIARCEAASVIITTTRTTAGVLAMAGVGLIAIAALVRILEETSDD